MIRIIQILVVFIASSLGLAAQVNLTVCTYNVKSFEGDPHVLPSGKSFDMPFFIDALKPLELDIIAVQEVEILTDRMGKRDLLAELAEGLGMYSTFGQSYVKEEAVDALSADGLYGNGLLSRYPILMAVSKPLVKPQGSSDPRSVLFADIRYHTGDVIRIVATHLDHVSGQKEQLQQILSDPLVTNSPYPILLLGDFNMMFDKKKFISGYEYLASAWVDYIFAPRGTWRVVRSKTQTDINYSDHWPVVAEVELVK